MGRAGRWLIGSGNAAGKRGSSCLVVLVHVYTYCNGLRCLHLLTHFIGCYRNTDVDLR